MTYGKVTNIMSEFTFALVIVFLLVYMIKK